MDGGKLDSPAAEISLHLHRLSTHRLPGMWEPERKGKQNILVWAIVLIHSLKSPSILPTKKKLEATRNVDMNFCWSASEMYSSMAFCSRMEEDKPGPWVDECQTAA